MTCHNCTVEMVKSGLGAGRYSETLESIARKTRSQIKNSRIRPISPLRPHYLRTRRPCSTASAGHVTLCGHGWRVQAGRDRISLPVDGNELGGWPKRLAPEVGYSAC